MREERLEVGLRLRGPPGREGESARPPHLAGQLGRDANRFLVVATRDADQAPLEGVGVVIVLVQRSEQLADLGRDEVLVREPADGCGGLCAGLGAARRHHHALIPEENRGRLPEVVDLPEEAAKTIELRIFAHAGTLSDGGRALRSQRRCGTAASRPPVRPLGRRIKTSAISAPTTTMRVPPRRSIFQPARETPFSATAKNESTPLTASAPTAAA